MIRKTDGLEAGSFRDPKGWVFRRDSVVYRHVTDAARDDYSRLMESGLYENLVKADLLIPHEEQPVADSGAWKILKPDEIEFVSYPWEWSFSMLRDAAIATLDIAERAMDFGMILKDAPAFNIQFHKARPVLIDTLSLSVRIEGRPWEAYRQFCQHFLAPLALASRRDPRLLLMGRNHIDGMPLDLAATLLPIRTRLKPGLAAHVHLHARMQDRYAGNESAAAGRVNRSDVSEQGIRGILDSLKSSIRSLKSPAAASAWEGYYSETNYSESAFDEKKRIVADYLDEVSPQVVWDLGANTGEFSGIAATRVDYVIAFEADHNAADLHYRECMKTRKSNILPLVMDLTNPSPGLGWDFRERMSLEERGPADSLMALALIHHLAIGNNVPLYKISESLARLGRHLIIEWVPKDDSQVQRLLASREDVFKDYTREGFTDAFANDWETMRCQKVGDSVRELFLLRNRTTTQ